MPASVTTIASFPTPSATTGAGPDGQLFIDSKGDLLGATVLGGADGHGTTYEIAKVAGGYASTPTFLADIPDGLNTLANVPNLSADANGDLFGLMITGGANSLGTVVEFPAGGGAATTLVNFSGGAGGSQPAGQLLVDASGLVEVCCGRRTSHLVLPPADLDSLMRAELSIAGPDAVFEAVIK